MIVVSRVQVQLLPSPGLYLNDANNVVTRTQENARIFFFFTLDAFDSRFKNEKVVQQEILQCQVLHLRGW